MQSNQNYNFLYLLIFSFFLVFSPIVSADSNLVEQPGNQQAKLLPAGKVAPVCELKSISNNIHQFPEKEHWNLIFYWSLFCHSCTEEMPLVQEHLTRLDSTKVKPFFISLDSERMQKALINFCKKRSLNQPVLMEQIASDSYVTADQWGVTMTPSVFIVAPDGKIAYSHQGPMDIEKFFADFLIMSEEKTTREE